MTKDEALKLALEALENLKEVVAAAQALGIKAGATGKDMRLGESFIHDEAITAIKQALAQPEQDLIPKEDLFVCGQMGAHVTRVYAQPEQEPVADGLVRQYINSLVANKPDEAANATKAMVDYVYTSPPAQPKQEPVAWMCAPFGDTEYEFSAHQECENCVPCYTTPPKRPWVGLTGKEKELIVSVSLDVHDAVHRTNAKLKEKYT